MARKNKIAQTPEDNFEPVITKLGGKTVRGATPQSETEPDPDLFSHLGGKFVGKTPVPAKVSSDKE